MSMYQSHGLYSTSHFLLPIITPTFFPYKYVTRMFHRICTSGSNRKDCERSLFLNTSTTSYPSHFVKETWPYSTMSDPNSAKAVPVPQKSNQTHRKRRLFDFSPAFWQVPEQTSGTKVTSTLHSPPTEQLNSPEKRNISERTTCATCAVKFETYLEQRLHFHADWHKYNAKRKVHARPAISEDAFEDLSDLGSVGSLSGSESDTDEEVSQSPQRPSLLPAEKLEFQNPDRSDTFLIIHKGSLPDLTTLQSLSNRGSWAVIMAGGGHFVAAIWDMHGNLQRHKTFHRYTSRRKQGGSQAAADEARGAGSRIKSAGATLRRYGEQALVKEVRDLLVAWRNDLAAVQCVYARASVREKRDLLLGWEASPLKDFMQKGTLRNIPIPTRRATLKEATRVYEELSSVVISSVSLVETAAVQAKAQEVKAKANVIPVKSVHVQKSSVKGTDHLKKRDDNREKEQQKAAEQVTVEEIEAPEPIELKAELVELLDDCIRGDKLKLSKVLEERPDVAKVKWGKEYLSDARFQRVDTEIGLVGVAAACGNSEMVEWLLDADVSPNIGTAPYLITKNKGVRICMRMYWGKHADKFDYKAAGVPGPLSAEELDAMNEREREKRRKEREKKKEKAKEKVEEAKPPAQRAREMRAAAAEARMLGNRCAGCRVSLDGILAFERLTFKYCSTKCVSKHRAELNRM